MFFEMYQRGKEFYQTIFYYQQIMKLEFDGEDTHLLYRMWSKAEEYFNEKDRKERDTKGNSKNGKKPLKSKLIGR